MGWDNLGCVSDVESVRFLSAIPIPTQERENQHGNNERKNRTPRVLAST